MCIYICVYRCNGVSKKEGFGIYFKDGGCGTYWVILNLWSNQMSKYVHVYIYVYRCNVYRCNGVIKMKILESMSKMVGGARMRWF